MLLVSKQALGESHFPVGWPRATQAVMKRKVAGKIYFTAILQMKDVGYARVFHVFLVFHHH